MMKIKLYFPLLLLLVISICACKAQEQESDSVTYEYAILSFARGFVGSPWVEVFYENGKTEKIIEGVTNYPLQSQYRLGVINGFKYMDKLKFEFVTDFIDSQYLFRRRVSRKQADKK